MYVLCDYIIFHSLQNQKCSIGNEGNWPSALAEYIRQNDQALLENAKKVLTTFEEELLPCESLVEFCDVAGMEIFRLQFVFRFNFPVQKI